MEINDKDRVKRMCWYGSKLTEYVEDNKICRDDILSKYPVQWTVTTPLQQISLDLYNVSDEYKKEHSYANQNMFEGVFWDDWEKIADIVLNELPAFMEVID